MKNFIYIYLSFIILMITYCDSNAQLPQYELTAQNFSMDSGVYKAVEWDIFIRNTGSVPLEFAYAICLGISF